MDRQIDFIEEFSQTMMFQNYLFSLAGEPEVISYTSLVTVSYSHPLGVYTCFYDL